MGLHRDPTAYSTSPVEIQIRRLVWYQICFLDLRTSEATGPRPQIRLEDYDTQRPLNIDDIDLDRAQHGDTSVDVTQDRKHFTDMASLRGTKCVTCWKVALAATVSLSYTPRYHSYFLEPC